MSDKIVLTKEEFDKIEKYVNVTSFNIRLLKDFLDKLEKGFEELDEPL